MFPIVRVTMPASLAGAANGRLSDSLLVSIEPNGRLHVLAARAWHAMRAAAAADGIELTPTSTADTYRSYEQQLAAFNDRYTPTFEPNVNTSLDSRTFNGARWYKRRGVAALASPGTSNHGWGLAIDVANSSGARLDWMLANAPRFGFSWESQSEAWHLRYIAAETIPAAVLAFEASGGSQAVTPPAANGTQRPTLRKGATGDDVRYLQTRLGAHGHKVAVDGQFGPRTEQSVKAFQKKKALTVDGVVGPQTWPALETQP